MLVISDQKKTKSLPGLNMLNIFVFYIIFLKFWMGYFYIVPNWESEGDKEVNDDPQLGKTSLYLKVI